MKCTIEASGVSYEAQCVSEIKIDVITATSNGRDNDNQTFLSVFFFF
jgi:hypothetical protein